MQVAKYFFYLHIKLRPCITASSLSEIGNIFFAFSIIQRHIEAPQLKCLQELRVPMREIGGIVAFDAILEHPKNTFNR